MNTLPARSEEAPPSPPGTGAGLGGFKSRVAAWRFHRGPLLAAMMVATLFYLVVFFFVT